MGVVYKLKQEIIDFILEEKKVNPRLGCRNLVSIIEQKFQIKISKSSVNSVIKEADLSSSVGRKPILIEKRPLKYKIPEDKKIQSPENPADFTPPSPKPVVPVIPVPPPQPKPMVNFAKPSPVPKKVAPPSEILPKKSEKVIVEVDVPKKGALHDLMGGIFLKAAEWELNSTPVLGKIFSKYNGVSGLEADLISEILLFFPLFGIAQAEDVRNYNGSGLWALHGLPAALETTKILQFIEKLEDKKNFYLRLFNEIPQIFAEGKYFKIFLQDRSEIVCDLQSKTIWSNNVQTRYSSSISRATNSIITRMITNVQPFLIENILNNSKELASFYNLLAAFEEVSEKRVQKITLFDKNDREISEFNNIPNKKRHFIVGGDFQLPEIQRIYQDKLAFRAFKDNSSWEICEKEVILKSSTISSMEISLRAIFLRENGAKDPAPVILITNFLKEDKSTNEILIEFLKRWPNFLDENIAKFNDFLDEEENKEDFYKIFMKSQENKIINNEIKDLYEILGIFLTALNLYSQKRFFPPEYGRESLTTMKERFYQLPGYLTKTANFLQIHLKTPIDYQYHQVLNYAVKRLNEIEIFDQNALRIRVTV